MGMAIPRNLTFLHRVSTTHTSRLSAWAAKYEYTPLLGKKNLYGVFLIIMLGSMIVKLHRMRLLVAVSFFFACFLVY